VKAGDCRCLLVAMATRPLIPDWGKKPRDMHQRFHRIVGSFSTHPLYPLLRINLPAIAIAEQDGRLIRLARPQLRTQKDNK